MMVGFYKMGSITTVSSTPSALKLLKTSEQKKKTMSTISKHSLKTSLLQLQCHFTWTLLKQDVDIDDLEETIVNQIKYFTESNLTDYNLLSYICHLKNSNEKALRNLQKAEEIVQKRHPDEIARRSLVTWGNYAWIHYHMERYEEAQTYVSKVENSCKKLSITAGGKMQLPEVYAEQGWALLRFGGKHYERAKNCFENALKDEPDNPDFNAGYATALYRWENLASRCGEDTSPSTEALKRAVELNPEDTCVMALLALKLQDLNRVDEGERYIEEAMQKTPDLPYFLRYAAKFYRRKGEVGKAAKILEKALALTPNSGFLHHQLGICYREKVFQLQRSGNAPQDQVERLIELAISHFKFAADQKKKFVATHTGLANVYALGKRYEEAEKIYQELFQRNNLLCHEKQELYYYYGNFQRFHMRSVSKAIEYYIEGLKMKEESFGRNKCSEAVQRLLRQKVERGSRNATDFGTLGLVHKLNGETQKAIECYEKAIALDHNNEEYQNALFELRLSISS
ncbi:PREDICTED: LOW QUALITY PROTEIN: interferon-induced protein with tetratricopeptide repeats 5-like [Lepidothrix coronata]|uniref:LOW QUALITY PROTEIN: interferon-induced protein with tetratricopeptide repeats 5-like n=1 Tax=Lepidothrix coronata TaxID=321398 RepID=A0A6J0J986_9PASS|nr:PREDICTED: LOW QUALITY PROTEIN: interferon-induced protein with tetratricopeptide repeats 5-like [Lepidothrix coronata]